MVLTVQLGLYCLLGFFLKSLSFSAQHNDTKVEWSWAPVKETENIQFEPEPGDIIHEELTTINTNSNCSEQIDKILKSIPSVDFKESYETEYSNGNKYLTVVKVTKIPDDDRTGGQKMELGKRKFEKDDVEKRMRVTRVKANQIFGSDNRLRVSPERAQFSPHSSTALISCGRFCRWSCTGILIGPRHVLTAAHCINKEPVNNIKVGFLQRSSVINWYTVESLYVPYLWRSKRSASRKFNLEYDYALIKLSRSPGRTTIKMRSPALSRRTLLTFSAFNARHKMYKSTCRPLFPPKSLIITQCDAVRGNSGAGILVHSARNGYQVVGILSARAQSHSIAGRSRYYNVATYLTSSKILQIKRWIRKS